MYERKQFVTPESKHMLLKAMAFTLYLLDQDGEDRDITKKKRLKLDRFTKIFKVRKVAVKTYLNILWCRLSQLCLCLVICRWPWRACLQSLPDSKNSDGTLILKTKISKRVTKSFIKSIPFVKLMWNTARQWLSAPDQSVFFLYSMVSLTCVV